MTGTLCKMRDDLCKFRDRRPADYGLANSAARKVRRDFPTHTIDQVAAKYRLTVGEARGVVNATASRTTLDKMLKRGGWSLAVELMTDLLGVSLDEFLEEERGRLDRERQSFEARHRQLGEMVSHLRAVGSVGGDGPA